jgi:hypothetical protein
MWRGKPCRQVFLVRAGKPFSYDQGYSHVGAWPGADGPPFCGDTVGSLAVLFPPMLFPRHILASGPQHCFSSRKSFIK